MKYTFIIQTGRQLQYGTVGVWRCPTTLLLPWSVKAQKTNKPGACVALAGAAAEYKAPSIQCQAFVCFFDLLLTTAPPNMCGGEPAPPPLNTFPHINKPCRCRNAWGPALSLLLEFSLLIRWLFRVLHRHTPISKRTDLQTLHKPPTHLLALCFPSTHEPQVRGWQCYSKDKMVIHNVSVILLRWVAVNDRLRDGSAKWNQN